MKWFEPIIALLAVLAVVLPFYFKIRNVKKGKSGCGGICNECKNKDNCLKNFKSFIEENRKKDNNPLLKNEK